MDTSQYSGSSTIPSLVSSEKETSNRPILPSSSYFSDGERVIDFIIAFQPKGGGKRRSEKVRFRQRFEQALEIEGLDLEYEKPENSQDGKTAFIKIHATWEALTRQAELESIQMPLTRSDLLGKSKGITNKFVSKFFKRNPFQIQEELLLKRENFFTDAFHRDREHQFLIEDKQTFFSSAQRAYLVWSIISGITITLELVKRKKKKKKKEKDGEVEAQGVIKTANIQYLLNEGMYSDAFPLHDGHYLDDYSKVSIHRWPMRKYLYEAWARPRQWYKYQPLDEIRNYYGEKVGLYFAWLGFYTKMLIIPSILGLFVFISGLMYSPFAAFPKIFCNTSFAHTFKTLYDLCPYAYINAIFDNNMTTVFSFFMAIWVVLFLELWKRYKSELCARWDVGELDVVEEQVRPEYLMSVATTRINPISQKKEPYLHYSNYLARVAASVSSVLFFITVVIALIFTVLAYKSIGPTWWLDYFEKQKMEPPISPLLLTSITASVINGVFIALMNKVYMMVAWKLTEIELPRTDQKFEESYTYKVTLFQFVNFYGTLFYLSFIRGQFEGAPNPDNAGGSGSTHCPASGCLVDVSIQLGIIMTGKQVINNVMELGAPILKNILRRRKATKDESNLYMRWEQDYDLEKHTGIILFGDYLEMLIQFGFITMFVPAFPLAPLFALINNIIEIRLDAYKTVTQTRRNIPYRAKNIEPWYTLLNIFSKLAIISNALLIALTTTFMDGVVMDHQKSMNQERQNLTLAEFMLAPMDPFGACQQFTALGYDLGDCEEIASHDGKIVRKCYYRGYRNEKGRYNQSFFIALLGKLLFIIGFEHLVLFVQGFISSAIPDTPKFVKERQQRELFLQRQAFKEHEFKGTQHEKPETMALEDDDEDEEIDQPDDFNVTEFANSLPQNVTLNRMRRKMQQMEEMDEEPEKDSFWSRMFS